MNGILYSRTLIRVKKYSVLFDIDQRIGRISGNPSGGGTN